MPRKSQCPYCSKRYLYSTAYRNHIARSHPGLRANLGVPACEPDDTANQLNDDAHQSKDSAHEPNDGPNQLNHQPAIEDEEVAPADSDFESHSESSEEHEDTELPVPTTYGGAGAPLRSFDRPLLAEDGLYAPFATQFDFRLARWFIESRTPKEHVQRFFQDGLSPPECTIKSAYTLFEAVDRMGWGLGTSSWKTGTVDFASHGTDNTESLSEDEADLPRAGRKLTRFYYRDPVECARFLLGQSCFAKDMVFAPVTEWNGDIPKRPVYSEMHTAEWWWETQVFIMHC